MVSARARREQVAYAVSRGRSVRRSVRLLTVAARRWATSRMPARPRPASCRRADVRRRPSALWLPHRFGCSWSAWATRGRSTGCVACGGAGGPPSAGRSGRSPPGRLSAAHADAERTSNQVWAYDFVHDGCANGQQSQGLTIMDEWTRECLAIDVAGGIRSGRVIVVLSSS